MREAVRAVQNHDLAKVRVAGSNPVVRSNVRLTGIRYGRVAVVDVANLTIATAFLRVTNAGTSTR